MFFSIPTIFSKRQKFLNHIKRDHVTLMGRRYGGFFFEVMRMPAGPAAEWDTSVCQVSHCPWVFIICGIWCPHFITIIIPPPPFHIIKKNKRKLSKGFPGLRTSRCTPAYLCHRGKWSMEFLQFSFADEDESFLIGPLSEKCPISMS